jgi:hypothetical protein
LPLALATIYPLPLALANGLRSIPTVGFSPLPCNHLNHPNHINQWFRHFSIFLLLLIMLFSRFVLNRKGIKNTWLKGAEHKSAPAGTLH